MYWKLLFLKSIYILLEYNVTKPLLIHFLERQFELLEISDLYSVIIARKPLSKFYNILIKR